MQQNDINCLQSIFIMTDTRRSGCAGLKQNVSTNNAHLDISDERIQENDRILGENVLHVKYSSHT